MDPDWEDAFFNVVVESDNSGVVQPNPYDVQITLSSLRVAQEGEELYTTEYNGVPVGNFDFIREVDTITIMKKTGISILSIIFFSDFSVRTQVPLIVLDNNQDYVRVRLTQISSGKLIIF